MITTKQLLIALCCLLPLGISAQLEKGNTTLGGSAGLNFLFENNDELFQFYVKPAKTWMVADGLEIGGRTGITFFANDGTNGGFYEFAPMVNYYFNPTSSGLKFFAFVEAGLIGGFGDAENDTDFFLGLGVGGLSFLNENVAFQSRLGYNFLDDDFVNKSTIGITADLKAFLGGSQEDAEGSSGVSSGFLLIGGTNGGLVYEFYELGNSSVNRTSFLVNPKALYLISDQVGLGGALRLSFTSGNFTDDVFTFGLIPEARYYFKPLAGNTETASFFGTIATGIQYFSVGDFDDTSIAFNIGVGADWFIAPNVAVEGIFSFGHQELQQDLFNAENRIGANVFIQYFWNR